MGIGLHLYQMTYWESNGKWYVNDIKNFSGRSAKWYTPMRILNLSVEEYINLLIYNFHAKDMYYYPQTDFLNFYFANEKDAKLFCAYVNKQAKSSNYYCK